MQAELVVIHRKGDKKFNEDDIRAGRWLPWQTCLRKILIGHRMADMPHSLMPSDEIFTGQEAYRFLLEVACGLHSPMVGETEVFGQFKKLIDEFDLCSRAPWSKWLFATLNSILADVKLVRRKYLVGLGSQSYGSLARRKLKGAKAIHVIGSGIFVKDLLPWFLKLGGEVHIHCRSVEKATKLLKEVPGDTSGVQIHKLYEVEPLQLEGALVVAAPVPGQNVKEWIQSSRIEKVLDLRGECISDPICLNLPTHPLQKFFDELEQQKDFCQGRVMLAKDKVKSLVKEKFFSTQFRPFGWEDLCC